MKKKIWLDAAYFLRLSFHPMKYHRFRLVPRSDIEPMLEDVPHPDHQRGSDPLLQLHAWWLQTVGLHKCFFHPRSCSAASKLSGTNSTHLTPFTAKGATEGMIWLAYCTLHSLTSIVSSVQTQEALSSQTCPMFKKPSFWPLTSEA